VEFGISKKYSSRIRRERANVKLGIMSDSHGKTNLVRQAMETLRLAGAEAFVHCGDIGSLDVLDEFADQPLWFVWGNMDFELPSWKSYVEQLNLPWPESPVEFQVDGKRLAVFHGHEERFGQALQKAPYDYLLHGHTHRPDDYRIQNMRVINPGALCRVRTKTVALLDPARDIVEFISLDGQQR